ncbi:hypothetical protein J3R82DRAFT_6397 [Butyriboletus roseoflavus]|nr:hypothetical protein J3R82DRAFT_6397 [Butyriboletus roseoflavus]
MWAYVCTCKVVVCSMDKSWYDALVIRCPMPTWLALSEVCTDALSDAILVALPLRLLWRVKLPLDQRIMVLSVFSTSILVSAVSVAHTAYLMHPVIFTGGFTASMESAVSLIVCNLLVVVTFLYRVIRNGRDLTAGLSDKDSGLSNGLTTVDLNLSGGTLLTSTTGTAPTETNVSSLMFASASGGSVLPAVTVSTDTSSLPMTTKR